jgi:predicted TIM-barrel fold metal-dependent hydrolase
VYHGHKVIDVHGHLSTPPEFMQYAVQLLHLRRFEEKIAPYTDEHGGFSISDAQLEAPLKAHLQAMDERNIDVQLLTPRPVSMWHWELPDVQEPWCRTVNDVTARTVKLHPDRFVGMAQLPQNAQLDTANCLDEFDRCINTLGFVGAIVNPDPGADHTAPGMQYEYWYPLYAKAEQLNAPLMIHASFWRTPVLKGVPHNNQVNANISQFLATVALEHSHVFDHFPKLKVFVCHAGGMLNRFAENDPEHVFGNKVLPGDNLWYDTSVYDPDYLALAVKRRGAHRMMFGTEVPGSGNRTFRADGRTSDDLVPVIDGLDFLTPDQKVDILHRNARRFFPRLEGRL